MRFSKNLLSVLAAGLLIFSTGCSDSSTITSADDSELAVAGKGNKPDNGTHFVSVGGNDACEFFEEGRGCDGNFSLSARMDKNGDVSGQWQDTVKGGEAEGIHVAVDCLIVDGNSAVVGGEVTKGVRRNGTDLTGWRAVTKVWDNGTSSKDPVDQISFTVTRVNSAFTCESAAANFDFAALDMPVGQVIVR